MDTRFFDFFSAVRKLIGRKDEKGAARISLELKKLEAGNPQEAAA